MTDDLTAILDACARALHEAKRRRGVALPPYEELPDHRRAALRQDVRAVLVEAQRVRRERPTTTG